MSAPNINPDGTSANGGRTSTIGAVIAIAGVVAAAYPKAVPVVSAAQSATPALEHVVPIVMTAVGSVVSAFGHPPAWLRRLFRK